MVNIPIRTTVHRKVSVISTTYWLMLASTLFLSVLTRPVYAASGPMELIHVTVEAVLAELRTTDSDRATKRARIYEIIAAHFDYREMAQRTLATNWKAAGPEDQKRFVDLYTRLLQSTYMAHIENYTNQKVEYRNERIRNSQAIVETAIIDGNTEIPISYKLRDETGKSWQVYDVVIEGVSLIATYRGEYAGIVKNNGIAGLLSRLEEKIRSLEQAPTT